MLTKKRKVPVCWTPSRNSTLMDWPFRSGVASATVPAASDELRPPPEVCVGGVSSVVAVIGQTPAGQAAFVPVMLTVGGGEEVRARRSAVPAGTVPAKVVMSTMRKRRRVMLAPVLFVTVRRIESVPKVELFGGSEVKSRARLGELEEPTPGSRIVSPTKALRWIGPARFSGPGAPSVDCRVLMIAPFVATKAKSLLLLSVSCGRPPDAPVILRMKLNST